MRVPLRRATLRHLLFVVLALMAASQAVVGFALYRRLQTRLEADLARRLERVAALLSFSVDGPTVAQFQAGDESLPAYALVRARLSAQAEAAGVTRAYVLDASHRTLVDTEAQQPPGRARHALLVHAAELAQARRGRAAATRLYADESGRLRLTAFAPLRAPAGLLVAVDAPPEFFESLEVVRREMLLLGTVALGLVALAGGLVLRQVDARLARLREMATHAVGGPTVAVAQTGAGDAIGALGRDVDRLIAEVVTARDRHEAVLASLELALLTCDDAGRVTLANPRAGELLGRAPRELIGRPLDELVAGEEALHGFVRRARESAAPVGAEVPVAGGLAAGGRVLAASASRLVQGPGAGGGLVLSLLDVTSQRRAELRARENERLAALGGMAGGLLHELGNPLAALAMYLDLLRPLAAEGEAREIIDRARREDDRLREFLEDFRVFAGLAAPRWTSVDLARVVEAAVEPLGWPSDVTRRTEGGGSAVGDARLLAHAVRNLLRNALEAGATQVVVSLHADEKSATIHVGDNGPGLAADVLERGLEPFQTTKPHGTGLGLLIARRVAELHGGRLEAHGGHGPGARFVLSWPAQEKERPTWHAS